MKKVIAFDLGASSGRAMVGELSDNRITIREIHRFLNEPVLVRGTLYWDVLRLFHEMKQGLVKAKAEGEITSLGVDTWGVDFGLIDAKGRLLENPVHYRDIRTKGMLKAAEERISLEELYRITGNQLMEINTAFQLLSLVSDKEDTLERADTLLLMPDLFNYLFTGKRYAEYSIASTTQLLDAKERQWSEEVLKALGISEALLPEVIPSGTLIGSITDEIKEELNVSSINVAAVAGHDTQSALVAVPAREKDFLFISCGTWSLMGTELDSPLIDEKSAGYNFTNEGGFGGKISFLKNLTGLWLVQESRRWWEKEGISYSFSELEKMAESTEAFQSFIDTDSEEFALPGNLPDRIREFCRKTGQKVPVTPGEIVRCINESLSFRYRTVMEEIADCTGLTYDRLYIVGGGINSKLLCKMTACACKKEVVAGPSEATVYGNIALQLIAAGDIENLTSARSIIGQSAEISIYQPMEQENWEAAYQRYKALLD
ncbi:MAG: Sugar (pentulose and hexulose) kinase [Anaerocolumna sp.]|nr:Sugar (pentulose and hexulose) kinase [Anaerocolumna sp.]